MEKRHRGMHTRYHYAGERGFNSPIGEDFFSLMVSRILRHRLLFFASLLIGFLLLSIACDQLLASSHSGAQAQEGAASAADNLSSQLQLPDSTKAGAQMYADAPSNVGSTRWFDHMKTLAFRLTLAAVLGTVVAFRPRTRRTVLLRHRNAYVVQTQILLAVVACALMMIVGDSAARAFGIFAAASLVRFRTNIRDPKEVTVLLINLGVGLAAGVGRWELATMFALFVMLLLRLLESYEGHQAFRTMECSVKTRDVEATDTAVRELFKRNNLVVDTSEFNRASDKHPLGKVVYSLAISPGLNTDRLAEDIYESDPINIDRVEWHGKKTPSYV